MCRFHLIAQSGRASLCSQAVEGLCSSGREHALCPLPHTHFLSALYLRHDRSQLFPHYFSKHLKCFPHLENHPVGPQVYKVPVCNHLFVGFSSLSAFSYCRNKTNILSCVPSISLVNSLILEISLRKLGKSGLNFS